MRSFIVAFGAVLTAASATSAAALPVGAFDMSLAAEPLRTSFGSWPSCRIALEASRTPSPGLRPLMFAQDTAQPVHAAAIEHSDGYQTRAKIHKYASYATLPLFVTELALGQSLYDGTESNGKQTAHAVVGAGIVGLFGVNTVTGLWNMFGEGRQETEGKTIRLVHGLLMMAADVGFLATTATAPSNGRKGALTFDADRVTHRNLAIASISVGTAGYLLMLFGNH